jgi:hypothetical protein
MGVCHADDIRCGAPRLWQCQIAHLLTHYACCYYTQLLGAISKCSSCKRLIWPDDGTIQNETGLKLAPSWIVVHSSCVGENSHDHFGRKKTAASTQFASVCCAHFYHYNRPHTRTRQKTHRHTHIWRAAVRTHNALERAAEKCARSYKHTPPVEQCGSVYSHLKTRPLS